MVVKENYSLINHNTFHIDVSAKEYVELLSESEIIEYTSRLVNSSSRFCILGGGSNVLFTKDFSGTVLHIKIDGIEIIEQKHDYVLVEAGAGVVWDDLVTFVVDNNFGGIENLTSIPGTVGAAPIQNIGAYGVELKDVFHSLNAVEIETGNVKKFSAQDCKFSYRESVFKNELKGQYVITSVLLKLSTDPQVNAGYKLVEDKINELGLSSPCISDIRKIIAGIRKSKLPDPDELGNAGSFFKNPVIGIEQYSELSKSFDNIPSYKLDDQYIKVPAAWLIELCGLKGYREGNVGTHKTQPLVLVNYGGANGAEIVRFAEKIQSKVQNKFGIQLHPEVNIV